MIFSQGNSTNRFEFMIIHADSSVEPEVDKFEGYLRVRVRGVKGVGNRFTQE